MFLIFRRLLVFTCLLTAYGEGATAKSTVRFDEEIQDWQLKLELARVLSYQKKYEESIREYESVLALQPQREEVKLELAQVYAYSGQEQAAMRLLEGLSIADLNEKQQIELAAVYAILKRYLEAETLYERYLKAHPEDLTVRLKYAEMLSWEKKYSESLREFEDLIRQRPEDDQLRRKYALVLIWSGNTEKAKEELRHILQDTAR